MAVSELGQGPGMQWKKSDGYSFASSPIAVLQDWLGLRGKREPEPTSLSITGYNDVIEVGQPWQLTAGLGKTLVIHAAYDDGSERDLQPDELSYTIAASDGSKKPLKLGQTLGEMGIRTITASIGDGDAMKSVELSIMVHEVITDDQKIRLQMADNFEPSEDRLVFSVDDQPLTPQRYDFDPSMHIVTISPGKADFYSSGELWSGGWIRAHRQQSMSPLLSAADERLFATAVISDPDEAWITVDQARNRFRAHEFEGFSRLVTVLAEELTTKLLFGDDYRSFQYSGCTSLRSVPGEEAVPAVGIAANSISGFRDHQFSGCTHLETPLPEHSPNFSAAVISPAGYRASQYAGCTALTVAADEDPVRQAILGDFRSSQYSGCTSLTTSKPEHTFDQSGSLEVSKIGNLSTFRQSQYAGCTALLANGVEKMLETLTGEPSYNTSVIRADKYKDTGLSDTQPFYYQGNDTDPVPALSTDTYTWMPSGGGDAKIIKQWSLYGGQASDPVSIDASTDSSWKSSYQQSEVLRLDGLTVTVTARDGSTQAFTAPFTDAFSFEPAEGTELHADDDHVSIRYTAGDTTLTTSVPITVMGEPVLQSISVQGPTKTSYTTGEQLSLDGLTVKAQWLQNGTASETTLIEKAGQVTDGYSLSLDGTAFTSESLPAAPTTAGEHVLTVSYTTHTVTKTAEVRLAWAEPPTPASLEVVGSMPGADHFYSEQIFTWRGATAAIVKTDGSREHVELLDNDAVSLVPGEGASLVTGSTTLKATLTLTDGQKLEWTREITVQDDEVESITRKSNSFDPVWTAKDNLYTTPIADLPVVDVTMKSQREKTAMTTSQLLDFTSRIDVFGGKTIIVGIEIAYGDTARHVIASLADKTIDSASGGGTISGYRYLSIAGGDRTPVSGWLTITPPTATV